MLTPREMGVPHDEWRPGQGEAIYQIRDTKRKSVTLLSAPTGSGKSGGAAGLGHFEPVLALTGTHSLMEQYANGYGFSALFGMQAYQCALLPSFNANECSYRSDMYKCPVAIECDYLIARKRMREAHRAVLSYAFYSLAGWTHNHKGVIFADEAHDVPDLLLERSSVTFTTAAVNKWKLRSFPMMAGLHPKARHGKTVNWLGQWAIPGMEKHVKSLQDELEQRPNRALAQRLAQAMSLLSKCQNTLLLLIDNRDISFIDVKQDEKNRPVLEIAPLTARGLFHNVFWAHEGSKPKLVLASATIGEPRSFARSIGLEDWDSVVVPSAFTPEQRRVHFWESGPRLNHKSTDVEMRWQAGEIARVINRFSHGPGVVHVTSKKGAREMKERLAKYLKRPERLWMPPEVSTKEMEVALRAQLKREPGTVLISWTHWQGFDFREGLFSIVAKIPFGDLSSEIARERMKFDRNEYSRRACNLAEQACGRVRRGVPEHYENGTGVNRFVGIFDSNWTRVSRFASRDFLESIVKFSEVREIF